MTKKCIFFDLDGTLTDSGPGIMNCAIAVFQHYGLPIPEPAQLRTMVGPPLRESFPRFGIPVDQVENAIAIYRLHYNATGKFENTPYPGIPELLQKLKGDGHRLFVATSKPEHMSIEILEHFGLASYFEHICGSMLDGVRDKKADVIAYLLERIGSAENVIMVGDTVFDVLGANEHQIPTIAVGWGYGDHEDIKNAGAIALATDTQALYSMLSK